jgi:type VI secretion system protein ImpA
MASAEVVDFAKLLKPIPGDNPAGTDLRADRSPGGLYDLIKDARSAARAAERQQLIGSEAAETNPPDWNPVVQNATKALAEKSKDLELTAYLIEALLRKHGFAGLRDGFRLAREVADQFWEKLYPLPDEEGVENRVAALTGLNGADAEGTLLVPIARVPLTERTSVGCYSWSDYQSANALDKVTDPKAREKRLAQGGVTGEAFRKAVSESSSPFFVNLVEDLNGSLDEFAKLDAVLKKRCGEQAAPPTSKIRDALVACLDAVKHVARAKLPVPEKPPPDKDKEKKKEDNGNIPAESPDVIRTREDAFKHLLRVAEYFHRTEPHSIVAYTLEQVVRWGRMPLPELLTELIPEENPRKAFFRQVGIRPPEPPGKESKK